jgi:hypothetical protein
MDGKMDAILANTRETAGLLRLLAKQEKEMSGEIDSLKTNVEQNTTVTGSAIALLQSLKTELDAAIASGDMSQVQALSDKIGANDQALADAITANTPAAPQQ